MNQAGQSFGVESGKTLARLLLLLVLAVPASPLLAAPEDPARSFRARLERGLARPFLPATRIVTFSQGDHLFPEMLREIGAAKHSIHLEAYIFDWDEVGQAFTKALADRAGEGVQVRVLLDAVGSHGMPSAFFRILRRAGAEVRIFRPLQPFSPRSWPQFHRRDHRRALIIDDESAFVGGMGLSRPWKSTGKERPWRDRHYLLTGPVTGAIRKVFEKNWKKSGGGPLPAPRPHRPDPPAYGVPVQVIAGPTASGPRVRQAFSVAIASARESIEIATAYFVPDREIREDLLRAVRRGVRIRILVPGEKIDIPLVRAASRHRWRALLEAGVEIHEYRPAMYHAKSLIVDDALSLVGTANLDPRSFDLNEETVLLVADQVFARVQRRLFEADLGRARRVTLQSWSSRSFAERVGGHFAWLLAPLL